MTLFIAYTTYATTRERPPLQDGDLIFQTSTSNQAKAIFVATASPYTHMGIIRMEGQNAVVMEAVQPVRETPLAEWIARGVAGRYSIYRHEELDDAQRSRIVEAARSYYGQGYDIFFSFDNDTIYCSELPYLAYKTAGVSIGTVQKVNELNFDNPLVKKLIEKRWQRHEICTTRGYDFDACYAHILEQDLVTPESIAEDASLKRIYSNYPL